jgi:hypothetical protein
MDINPTIQPMQDAIDALYKKLRDQQAGAKMHAEVSANGAGPSPSADDNLIIEKALGAKNGEKFAALWSGDTSNYPSRSEADLAFCRIVAFFTQHEDQIDRLYRQSGLMREKWERADYRSSTIDLAIRTACEHWGGVSAESSNGQPGEDTSNPDGVLEDERHTSGNSDTPPMTLADIEQCFQKWLGDDLDLGLIRTELGAIAANLIEGADAVWLMEIGGSGWGKTEHLQSASGLPFVHMAATLTEAALLSGTPRKDKAKEAKGGLLREIGEFGVLILKDFTSILSMHRDGRAAVLAALREIYDGHWARYIGVDGGRKLEWRGKLGIIAGVTNTIDRHHTVITTMGERFVFYRITPPDEERQALQALANVGKEKIMRAELMQAVTSLFASIDPPTAAAKLSGAEKRQLIAWARLAARSRSPIERDPINKHEIELIPDPEAPARLTQILLRLFTGMLAIGVPRADAWQHLKKVAFDSMPAIRCRVLEFLIISGTPERATTDIATSLGYPTDTAKRALEDLTAHGMLQRRSQGQGKADLWCLSPLATTLLNTTATG